MQWEATEDEVLQDHKLIFDSEEGQKEKKSVQGSESIETSRTMPMDTGCARGSAPPAPGPLNI